MSAANNLSSSAHSGASSEPASQPRSEATTPQPEPQVAPTNGTGRAAHRERAQPTPRERRARLAFLRGQAEAQGLEVPAHLQGQPLIRHLEAVVVNVSSSILHN